MVRVRLGELEADEHMASMHANDPIVIGKHPLPREDATEVLGNKLDTLPRDVRDTTRVSIGSYKGLRFGLILHPSFPPDVYLEGELTRIYGLSKEHQGPRAVLNALERIATSYGSEIVRIRSDASIAQSQLRDYQARLGKLFTHEGYLTDLTGLRDALKSALSGRQEETESAEGPSLGELAARIKELKAANTIETTAHRTQRKQIAAEEPVTARIRRRQEESALAGEEQSGETPAASEPQSMSFQERILRERQHMSESEGQSPP